MTTLGATTQESGYHHVKLENIKRLAGFSTHDAQPGEEITILTRACLTSDDPEFSPFMDQISTLVFPRTGVFVDTIHQFLIVWHMDGSADLHLNGFPVFVEIRAKRAIRAGQVVTARDIADISSLRFPSIELASTDNLIYCFKVGWKFGLFFDLGRASPEDEPLDVQRTSNLLGHLYRYLFFKKTYDAISSKPLFGKMILDGWFPFVEMLGRESDELVDIYKTDFDKSARLDALVDGFEPDRIQSITKRWWNNPVFESKRDLLQAGVDSYLKGQSSGYISALKILLTEIEGILRSVHRDRTGQQPVTQSDFICCLREVGIVKAGSDESLFFPKPFARYLTGVVFGHFDPDEDQPSVSRHTCSHGIASSDEYTQMRALQAILALDQIYFFT